MLGEEVFIGVIVASMVIFGLIFGLSYFIYYNFLAPNKFDEWIYEIAVKHIGTTLILHKGSKLYLDYDIKISEKEKKSLIEEINDKSTRFSYFLLGSNINERTLIIESKARAPIPTACKYENAENNNWNIVPIGKCVNPYTQSITSVGWYLNDQNKDENYMRVIPSTSIIIAGGTGSGKSVLEQTMVAHMSKYSDHFQVIGIDCKRVEFNLLRGVKSIKSVSLEPLAAASAARVFRRLMQERFKFMEESQVNNVYKIKDKKVDYYSVFGKDYQFDEIFEVTVDDPDRERYLSQRRRYYDQNDEVKIYNDEGKLIIVDTIKNIYNKFDEYGEIDFGSSSERPRILTKNDIMITKGIYKPKALVLLIDEYNELMTDDTAAPMVNEAVGSIARLGRAAATHLILAMQKPSIRSDIMQNIQMSVALGNFDSGTSSTLFDKDISHLAKPEIKGRAFLRTRK